MIKLAQPNQQGWGVQRVFPGLDEEQTGRLYESVGKLGISDPIERLKKEQEVYQQVLPLVKQQQQFTDRANAKNELFSKSLDDKKSQEAINFRGADFADRVKEQKGIGTTAPDTEVLGAFVKENPDLKDLVLKHVNEGDDELLYELGLKEKPLGRKVLDTAKKAGVGALAAAAGLGGLYAAGEAIQGASKSLYSAVVPKTKSEVTARQAYKSGETNVKPTKVSDIMIETPTVGKEGVGAGRLGFFGSKTDLASQAKVFRRTLQKDEYKPAFKALDDAGVVGDYRLLREKTIERIDGLDSISETDKKLAKRRVNDLYNDHYNWDFGKNKPTMEALNKEAKTSSKKLPKNYPEGGYAGDDVKIARRAIKDVFKDEVYTQAKKLGFDLKQTDIKYGSVANIIKEGIEAESKPLLRGGLPFAMVGNLSSAATTVVGTSAGKAGYKIGGAMKYLPEKLVNAAKKVITSKTAKTAGKTAGQAAKNLGKGLLAFDPIGTPEILQYIPGTLGDIFAEFVATNPANVTFDAMIERAEFKSEMKKHIKKVEEFKPLTEKQKEDMMAGRLIIL